ncbi:MAG TPA: hypothetical protein VGY76_03205 [Solirubrobacteraceae bacterium]|jgi:hypothetical protein|nr:hypothetical protein [Solirubrobacteraceae bacterium]
MQRQIQLLRRLVLDSQYTVDPASVANAILVRAATRRAVLGTSFRNDLRTVPVRSFRPSRQARSFRPCNAKGLGEDLGLIVIPPRHRR